MKSHIHSIILCGGSGTRLWPLSSLKKPKQFLSLNKKNSSSLLQEAISRTKKISNKKNRWIVTHENSITLSKNQANNDIENYLTEPCSQNTAAAIAYSAYKILNKDPSAVMVILSSDHHIEPLSEFLDCINSAIQFALKGFFCTIGIKPTHPASGFGYIEIGKALKSENNEGKAYNVKNFREKPSTEVAEEYLNKGNYLWNSGIFIWKAKDFWMQLKETQPEICAFFENNTDKEIKKNYHKLPNSPIDIAFLEKVKNIACIPSTFHWDDMGSWTSVFNSLPKDLQNNILKGDVISFETKNSLVISTTKKQSVATLGLDNQAVIVTDDVILVMPLNKAQDIKALVSRIKKQNRTELL